MILTIVAAAAIAAQLGSAVPSESNLLSPVQYCGRGYDLDIYGRCYPNGVIPYQYQSARRGGMYRGGRYPVPCGNGADLDSRDGQCYPTGTVPPRFQSGRQEYYYDRPRRGYY
jgi:hypothetical protein